MKIVLKASGRIVLASGTLVLGPGEVDWEIQIEDLNFLFRFVENPDIGQAAKVVLAEHTDKSSIVHLENWNNNLGTSYTVPGIAIIAGKPVDVAFFVDAAGEPGKLARAVSFTVSQPHG